MEMDSTRGTVVEWMHRARTAHDRYPPDINQQRHPESELRLLNEQLRENAQLFQTTLASISQGIVLVDATGRVRTFNAGWCANSWTYPRACWMHVRCHRGDALPARAGDFGPEGQWVGEEARSNVMDTSGLLKPNASNPLPARNPRGQTLEVRTQQLPSGGLVRTSPTSATTSKCKPTGSA